MKTTKYILVTFVLMATLFSACTKEDKKISSDNKEVTLITTLAPTPGISTKTVMNETSDGTISTSWEVGDKIWVKYTNTSDAEVKAQATVTSVDGESGNATISVTLTDPKDASTITFGFPYNYWNEDKDLTTGQIGTLDNIKDNYAASSGTGTLTVSGGVATLPIGVTMTPSVCIWKLSFTDGSTNITSGITTLKIFLGTSSASENYVVKPSSLSNIYVAINGSATPKFVSITATTASGIFMKEKSGVTLTAGKLYTTKALALSKAYYFSVSASKKVIFAPGNLQATTTDNGANWTWNFATHQYDYVGDVAHNPSSINNKVTSTPGVVSANGILDLFYRSVTGNGYGIVTKSETEYYGKAFIDWGGLSIGSYPVNYWSSLTDSEWHYVVGKDIKRLTSATVNGVPNARSTKAIVNSVKGLLLFPDNYEGPTGNVGTDIVWGAGINSTGTSGWNTTVTLTGWATLEAAGCVFLPAVGYRNGASLSEVGASGYYKSATYWRSVRFDNSGYDPTQSVGLAGSIRLSHQVN